MRPSLKGPPSQLAITLSLLAAFAVTAKPASAQKVALRWKYEQGTELVYRVSNHQEMDVSAMGGTQTSEQTQTMRWRVVEVAPNGDATINVTTERIQIDMQGLAGNVKYDSQTDAMPTDPQTKILAGMAGLSYTMVIGPSGTVKSVRGLDELREKVLGAVPPEQAGIAQAMSGELFSEESMTRMMQQSVQLFPDEPVSPSDSWHNSFSVAVPIIGTMTTNLTFTLAGIEQREGRTVAVISNTGDIVIGNDATSQLPVTFDIGSTNMTGSIDFDVDRGVTLASNVSMTMQMSFAAGGQTMAMGMIQKTSVELIEYGSGR